MTSRQGGVSQPPYDSMNLGEHVQDDAQAVAHNRRRLQQATGAPPVFLQQVHGVEVAQLCADSPFISPPLQADACFTTACGVACTIMVADCLPVLLTHRQQRIAGAAHAGWRSLAGPQNGNGVLERLVQQMRQAVPAAQADGWLAWLGPCIGPTAFEVGDEVRQAFVAANTQAHACFAPAPQSGKWFADLAGLARQRLAALGVQAVYGNDSTAHWCTYGHAARYYSFRREARTGRMAAAVWLRPD